MHYSTRIEDYLAAIEDNRNAFIVAERDEFTIINYNQMGNDTFPDPNSAPDEKTARNWALRRQCRGLIFDLEGNVISLPIHKFFNAGEREETLLKYIDLTQPHVELQKLDGSMVRPIPTKNGLKLGTKMGFTDVAEQAEKWCLSNPSYKMFMQEMMNVGLNPIFEWCTSQQKIVIDYPVDRLVLIAIRSIEDGLYLPYHEVSRFAKDYGIEVVEQIVRDNGLSIHELHDIVLNLKGEEGRVLVFGNGEKMYKLKAEDYLIKHRAKDKILRENGVLELILDEKLDDIKPVLDQNDLKRIENYENDFWNGVNKTAVEWKSLNEIARNRYGDNRKEFALEMAPHVDQYLKGHIFGHWNDWQRVNWKECVLESIRKNLSSQKKVDGVRHLFGKAVWKYVELDA